MTATTRSTESSAPGGTTLKLACERRFGTAGARSRRIGIVAVARKLAIALWRYVEHGVIPEGARLKA
jgi:transposase